MSKAATTTMITSIPQDLISDVLSRLPVKSLLQFKCVSKLWCSLISSSSFIELHLSHSNNNQQILLYDHYLHSINCDVVSTTSRNEAVEIASPFDTFELEIMGSCDGLLLISPYQDIVFLWNPSTNELKILPPTPIDSPPRDNYPLTEARAMVFGLGYDTVAKDYKVVRIVVFDGFGSDKDGSEVKVYTLGTDSWRRIGEVPESWKWIGESPYAARDQTISRSGKHVNGRLHWLLYDKNETESEWEDGGCTEQLNVSKVIVSFHIESEKYIEVPQPDYRDDNFHMNVDVLGGCLCILANYETLVMDVWVMKNYGVKESWTRLFTIAQGQLPTAPSFSHLIPMKLTMEGDVLLVVDYRFLILYEPICEKARRLEIHNLPNYFKAEIYVQSLVSMNGIYMGQEHDGWKKKWTDIWNRKLKRMERGSRKALEVCSPGEIIITDRELEPVTS